MAKYEKTMPSCRDMEGPPIVHIPLISVIIDNANSPLNSPTLHEDRLAANSDLILDF